MGLIGKLEALDVPLYAAKDDDASSMAGRAPVSISEMERCFKMGFIPPLLLPAAGGAWRCGGGGR